MNGGSQSFNTVNTMRILGRWMRMITIPNQSSVPKAWTEFDDTGRMKVHHSQDCSWLHLLSTIRKVCKFFPVLTALDLLGNGPQMDPKGSEQLHTCFACEQDVTQ